MKKELIYRCARGALEEDETLLYLVTDPDGALKVEKYWSYVNPYKLSKPARSGSVTMTVDEFYASSAPDQAKSRLREMLETRV